MKLTKLRNRIDYNKSDFGELGDYIKVEYVHQHISEAENDLKKKIEEPKKTLYDKIISRSESGFDCYYEKDVKEALREFINELDKQGDLSSYTRKKATEVFGEELLKWDVMFVTRSSYVVICTRVFVIVEEWEND